MDLINPSGAATTFHAGVGVRVVEDGVGNPWICLDFDAAHDVPIQGAAFAGLKLKPGTTYEQARALAQALKVVTHLSITAFHQDAPARLQ